MAPTPSNPWRTLIILLVILVGFSAIALIQGATSINLGLDLRGGTSVTLQPKVKPGEEGRITAESIDEAVNIIRQRVDGLGVAESEVSAQGTGINRQILISVPGRLVEELLISLGRLQSCGFAKY